MPGSPPATAMSFEVLFFAVFAGGWLFARLFDRLRLPAVMGMTLFGVVLRIVAGAIASPGAADAARLWPDGFAEIVPFIKSLALIIILLRAGLGLRRADLKAAGIAAALMTFVPCLFEGFTLMGLFMLLFGFPWDVAGLTGFLIAAVSPAVVVPAMLDLQSRDIGRRNGVVTTVLAGASADDVFSITLFTVFIEFSTAGSAGSALLDLARIPISIAGGLLAGVGLGVALAAWFRRHHQAIRATEKALLLLASAVFLVQVGNRAHLAALLGVMAAGFLILERAETQAHELASKMSKVWVAAQIALFVIIGMSLDVGVALRAGPNALLAIAVGLVARSAGVMLATWPSAMSVRERLFCVIAYVPKATVQAALGGVALSAGLAEGPVILAIAVLAIIVTAPLGLIGIRWGSRRLLTNPSRP